MLLSLYCNEKASVLVRLSKYATMKKSLIALATIAAVVLTGCKKSSTAVKRFSFGTAYSMCSGDCAAFYQIQNDELFKDDMNAFLSWPPSFDYSTPLPNNKYQLAKQLLDSFPAFLLNKPDSVYGCPDCHDQGGVHIRMEQGGVARSWHLDTDDAYTPSPVKEYVNKVEAVIKQLN
jgi:hypothetical protein